MVVFLVSPVVNGSIQFLQLYLTLGVELVANLVDYVVMFLHWWMTLRAEVVVNTMAVLMVSQEVCRNQIIV